MTTQLPLLELLLGRPYTQLSSGERKSCGSTLCSPSSYGEPPRTHVQSSALGGPPMLRRVCCLVGLLLACAVLAAAAASNARKPKNQAELRDWLQNMVWYHRFSADEIADATGLARDDIAAALKQFDVRPDNRPKRPADAPL